MFFEIILICFSVAVYGQAVCDSGPCHNGGTCINEANGYFSCVCPPGKYGLACESDHRNCLGYNMFINYHTMTLTGAWSWKNTPLECRNQCDITPTCIESQFYQGFQCFLSDEYDSQLSPASWPAYDVSVCMDIVQTCTVYTDQTVSSYANQLVVAVGPYSSGFTAFDWNHCLAGVEPDSGS